MKHILKTMVHIFFHLSGWKYSQEKNPAFIYLPVKMYFFNVIATIYNNLLMVWIVD